MKLKVFFKNETMHEINVMPECKSKLRTLTTHTVKLCKLLTAYLHLNSWTSLCSVQYWQLLFITTFDMLYSLLSCCSNVNLHKFPL